MPHRAPKTRAAGSSPLGKIRAALGTPGHPLPLYVVAAAARVSVQAVARLDRLEVGWMPLDTLVRIAHALGAAPVDLVPGLGSRPGGDAASRVRSLVRATLEDAAANSAPREENPPDS